MEYPDDLIQEYAEFYKLSQAQVKYLIRNGNEAFKCIDILKGGNSSRINEANWNEFPFFTIMQKQLYENDEDYFESIYTFIPTDTDQNSRTRYDDVVKQ